MQVKDLNVGEWLIVLPQDSVPPAQWGKEFKILEKIQNDKVNVVDSGRMVYTISGNINCEFVGDENE
ncbi:hypothetical protein [Caudoviricetes sp.]|nr:hypothetical protein [Caudoviricetes sp.]